jgi:hypothetical protein
MLKRRPIIAGSSDIDQLHKIFQLCGTPNKDVWPSFMNLPDIKSGALTLPFPETFNSALREKFSKVQYYYADTATTAIQ